MRVAVAVTLVAAALLALPCTAVSSESSLLLPGKSQYSSVAVAAGVLPRGLEHVDALPVAESTRGPSSKRRRAREGVRELKEVGAAAVHQLREQSVGPAHPNMARKGA